MPWKNCCHQIQKISNSSCKNEIHIQLLNKINFNDDENELNNNYKFAAVSTVSSTVSSKIVSLVTVFCEKTKKKKIKKLLWHNVYFEIYLWTINNKINKNTDFLYQ